MSRLLDEIQAELTKVEADRERLLAMLADARGEAPASEMPVSSAAFLAEKHPEIPWLFGGLIAEDTVTMVTADGGIGKTTMLVQMCIALAAGVNTMGFNVYGPKSVLMVEAEGSRAAFQARFRQARISLRLSHEAGEPWFIQPETCRDYMIGSVGLERMIEASGARLCVLDTLGYFFQGSENKADEWKDGVMRPLRILAAKYHTAFVLVHHHNKDTEKTGWQKGRGTTAMYGDVDHWLRLEQVEGEGNEPFRDLWVDKSKYGLMGHKIPLEFDSLAAHFTRR